MWVILALFLGGLVVAIERMLYFMVTYYPFRAFETQLLELLKDHKLSKMPEYQEEESSKDTGFFDRWIPWESFRYHHSSAYILAATYFRHMNSPVETRRSALERVGRDEIEKMENRVGMLSLLGQIAPLVGLLGTVTGMIHAFQSIAQAGGQPEISALAGGIWEAMMTTAFGLTVAIPAHIVHGFFDKINARRMHQMNTIVHHMDEKFYLNSASSPENEMFHSAESVELEHV